MRPRHDNASEAPPAEERPSAAPRPAAGAPEAALDEATPAARQGGGKGLAALGVVLWCGLVTWKLGSVPGMSMDEAWSILSARGEWPPDNPFSGMTSYSGPFPVLLLDVFGTDRGVWVLRVASVLANSALLALLALLLRRAAPNRSLLGWALPLLASSPVWLITLRTGIEVTMFTPLLSVLGLYLLLRATPRSAFAAGLVWGLLVYNHLIGIAFPAAVAVAWLAIYRRLPKLAWAPLLLGGLLVAGPRLLALVLYHDKELTGYAAGYKLWPAVKDLIWLPRALWETWHGDTVYLRYVGRLAFETWPYGLLALAFFVPWSKEPRSIPRHAWFALCVALGSAVFTTVGAPYIAVRFLTLPILGLGVFFVLLGAAAVERDARWSRWVRGAALSLAGFNLFYVVVDFYLPWQARELGVTTFFLGARSKRTASWAYLPKEELVRELSALSPPAEQILTTPSIERPLRVLLHGTPLSVALASDAQPGRRSVFVDYNRVPAPEPPCAVLPWGTTCYRDPVTVARYFVVYREP